MTSRKSHAERGLHTSGPAEPLNGILSPLKLLAIRCSQTAAALRNCTLNSAPLTPATPSKPPPQQLFPYSESFATSVRTGSLPYRHNLARQLNRRRLCKSRLRASHTCSSWRFFRLTTKSNCGLFRIAATAFGSICTDSRSKDWGHSLISVIKSIMTSLLK